MRIQFSLTGVLFQNCTRNTSAGQLGAAGGLPGSLEAISVTNQSRYYVFQLPVAFCRYFGRRSHNSGTWFTQIPAPDNRGTFFYFPSTSCRTRLLSAPTRTPSSKSEPNWTDGRTRTLKNLYLRSRPHFRKCAYGANI